jgi:hypothetical protein
MSVVRSLAPLLFVAACGASADVVQIWWDADDGPPTILADTEILPGTSGTLWLVTRVGGVAYVCETLDNGVEVLVEVRFNSEMIGYPPNPKTQKRKCDNKWKVTGPYLSSPPVGYNLPRLRIERATWDRET